MLTPHWNFGPIGNPAWWHLPEARESIKELVCEALEKVIDTEQFPEPVANFMYALHAVGPLILERLGIQEMDADLVRRFCLFCHDVLDYSGPDASDALYTFDMYIVDALDFPAAVRVIERTDPRLVARIRHRYPDAWAEQ